MYIAKLARLALLRDDARGAGDSVDSLVMLPLMVLAAACTAGEPTGLPTGSLPSGGPSGNAAVVLSPRQVTLEANQLIQFRAYDGMGPGSNLVTSVEWTATGGTIRSDGSYSSSSTGDFKVIATRQGNGNAYAYGRDTARVKVVPPQPTLAAVVVSPASATVMAGAQVQFTATGKLSDGSTVEIGVTWSATGGTIDAGGLYTAGASPGTFQVTATSVSAGLSATATVRVTALAGLKLNPSSASLPTGGTQQFSVTGVMSDSSTVPVANATFSATGGTITSTGLYTAPATAGSYTVTAASGTLSTSALVTVTASSGIYVHQPADYVVFAENRFSDGGATAIGTWSYQLGGNLTIVSDSTAPQSPNAVLQFRFPAGLQVGDGIGLVSGWRYAGGAVQYREFYESGWFKIPSADFETPGPGMKLLGYWGVGQYGSGRVGNQIYSLLSGTGTNTALRSSWALEIRQQNNVGRSMPANRSTKRIQAGGVWHHYEIQMVLNDVDVPNGILRVWLDNGDGSGLTLTHEYTDVMYRTSAAKSADGIDSRSGFYERRWDPIWGGRGGAAKSRDDYLWVDHLYLSGKPL